MEEWKQHVLSHYCTDELLQAALGDTIRCWIRNCPTVRTASNASEKKAKFLEVMDHVHDHMKSEEIGVYELRRDDHFTILFFWEELVRAYRSGAGISLPEMEFLYTEHVRPRGSTFSFAARDVEGMVSAEEDTGMRSDLQAYDSRSEDRELKRRARRAEGRGGAGDRGECSNENDGGRA